MPPCPEAQLLSRSPLRTGNTALCLHPHSTFLGPPLPPKHSHNNCFLVVCAAPQPDLAEFCQCEEAWEGRQSKRGDRVLPRTRGLSEPAHGRRVSFRDTAWAICKESPFEVKQHGFAFPSLSSQLRDSFSLSSFEELGK